ncbi:transcription cofactor vestigial-like protein 3 [Protopterus annectens]|uniref:transcription cofactor vestigial-like protein 3 n=1 Tax=Protopterus annectens TaxID=7888 RepID=UPI001CFC3B0D|nr:transcription cofactor vestigial-like protein 3 [Protopterus annectens]
MQESLMTSLQRKEEHEEKEEPAETAYISSRCVLITYFQGEIGAVVDEHFSRALSQGSNHNLESGLRSKPGSNTLWRDGAVFSSQRTNFPSTFWSTTYQTPPPSCLSGVHPQFSTAPHGHFHSSDSHSWPAHSLHQTVPPPSPSVSESWAYSLTSHASPSYSRVHDAYSHMHRHPHAHVHHHSSTSQLDPRYGSILMPTMCTSRLPAPQCDFLKSEPTTPTTTGTTAWTGTFHGTMDILPTITFDSGMQHLDKSIESPWF